MKGSELNLKHDLKLVDLSNSRRDVKRFLRVSYAIYKNDPCWVAPMLIDMQTVLSQRNPFLDHAEVKFWVVARDGVDVGRIAGIIDWIHNDFQKDAAAFFGFFESIDDSEASRVLFDAVFGWARQNKMARVLGPMNPSTNDECGLLVDGFDRPPVFMMPYNPRYYPKLIGEAGFEKSMDLLAYLVDLSASPGPRLDRISDRFQRVHPTFLIRPVTRKSLAKDLIKMREVYNDAWESNWGFVPMSHAEIEFMAKRLKPFLTEGLVFIAEHQNEPAAFMLSVLDYNQAFQPLRGRLLSSKLPSLVLYLLKRKNPTMARVMALGVKKKFRRLGLESVMLARALKYCLQAGHPSVETSWILENNSAVRNIIKFCGGETYKTYRIYARSVP